LAESVLDEVAKRAANASVFASVFNDASTASASDFPFVIAADATASGWRVPFILGKFQMENALIIDQAWRSCPSAIEIESTAPRWSQDRSAGDSKCEQADCRVMAWGGQTARRRCSTGLPRAASSKSSAKCMTVGSMLVADSEFFDAALGTVPRASLNPCGGGRHESRPESSE
jgi:hypothetical protein